MMRKASALAAAGAALPAWADGLVIEKVYHPYVDALETEIEYRAIVQDRQPGIVNPAQVHQFALGKALSDRVFGEIYLVGVKDRVKGFEAEAWEVELKWQLTEQGEYAVDWGVWMEYEDELDRDIQEFTAGVLMEKEWGRISGAANLTLTNEWGRDIADEVESALAMQVRYRHSALLEPSLEFYAGQDTRGMGPVLQGNINTGQRKTLHWEAGVIFGLDNKTADQTWRFLLEYEF